MNNFSLIYDLFTIEELLHRGDINNANKLLITMILQYGDDTVIQKITDIQYKRTEEILKND